MKRVFLSVILLLNTSCAFATLCTDYLEDIYSKEYNKPVKIKCKSEFIDKIEQNLGGNFISSITYGKAELKIPKQRKMRVSYFCLMESCDKPLWGYIIPD